MYWHHNVYYIQGGSKQKCYHTHLNGYETNGKCYSMIFCNLHSLLQVRNSAEAWCLDGPTYGYNKPLGVVLCHGQGGNQVRIEAVSLSRCYNKPLQNPIPKGDTP